MPRLRSALLLVFACMTACKQPPLPHAPAVPESEGPLTRLFWLAGTWSSVTGRELSEEHWTTPSSDLMLGLNRTVAGGITTHHETLRIESRDGGVFYVASPSGQETTTFELVDVGEAHAVFANPGHDYPKQITYRRTGSTLRVRIEGAPGERVAEWNWERSGPTEPITSP